MNRIDLKNYRYNQHWIQGRIEYIESYKSLINKLTSTISDTPNGSSQVYDTEAEKIVELEDTINELMDIIIEENKKQKSILSQLDKVEQPYKLILEKVYIQGKSLVTVASEMKYEYKYMCKQHGIALNKFENTTKEVERHHKNMF